MNGPSASDALLPFTRLAGSVVRGRDGHPAGRLVDLVVRHDEPFPRVTDAVVRRAGAEPVKLAVQTLADDGLVVEAGPEEPPDPHDVQVGRDFLDAQVIDIAGKRVARVGDVELAARNGEVRAVGVDVGLAPVARRLGLRRLSRRLRSEPIAWDQLHFASGRGHRLQLESPAAAVHRLDAAALAELVARLPAARAAEVLEAVAPDRAAAARQPAAQRRRRRFPVLSARKRAPS